jgi:hypothetical protein
MSSISNSEFTREKSRDTLRTIALTVVMAGAIGSLGLMLYTGRKNPSVILMLMFAVWVLSPFGALLVANFISRQWTTLTNTALSCLMLVVTAISWVTYSGIWTPPGRHTAFVFLVIPLLSWVLIVVVIPVAQKFSRNVSKGQDSQS